MPNIIAQTILRQLGDTRFSTMTGANNFVSIVNGLQFSLPRAKDGINKVVVKLNDRDNYDLEYWRIRGASVKRVKEAKNVGVENLRSAFTRATGLETSLGTMERSHVPLGRKRGL